MYEVRLCFVTDCVSALSPRCCERMVEDGAVAIIYSLMKSCNRSLPHMEIIKYSVNILLNLAKVSCCHSHAFPIDDWNIEVN